MFRPNKAAELRTVAMLRTVDSEKIERGRVQRTYKDAFLFPCNFSSFGGTESVVNGVLVIDETAQITCRYHPDIKANCRIKLDSGAEYEIFGEPENLEMRNLWLIFKVRRIKGGA